MRLGDRDQSRPRAPRLLLSTSCALHTPVESKHTAAPPVDSMLTLALDGRPNVLGPGEYDVVYPTHAVSVASESPYPNSPAPPSTSLSMSWALGYIMDLKRIEEYAIEHQLPIDVSRFGDLFDAVLAEWSRKSGYPPHWEPCIVGGESTAVFVLYLINPESVDDFRSRRISWALVRTSMRSSKPLVSTNARRRDDQRDRRHAGDKRRNLVVEGDEPTGDI
jgi:hypothetical protein